MEVKSSKITLQSLASAAALRNRKPKPKRLVKTESWVDDLGVKCLKIYVNGMSEPLLIDASDETLTTGCYLMEVGYMAVRKQYVHRLVMNAQKGQQVEHRNRNRLDCRKSNLRFSTQQQNAHNSGKRTFRGGLATSPFKGVWLCVRTRRWCAAIRTPTGERIWLRRHKNPVDAASAYNAAAKKNTLGSLRF